MSRSSFLLLACTNVSRMLTFLRFKPAALTRVEPLLPPQGPDGENGIDGAPGAAGLPGADVSEAPDAFNS